ncbi:MAG: hypothetical protein EAZ06_09455 [Cytophagales bacterium]|nr:MAG: hypothetical protein EAZ06_09455 [Cytophagales bacterium]
MKTLKSIKDFEDSKMSSKQMGIVIGGLTMEYNETTQPTNPADYGKPEGCSDELKILWRDNKVCCEAFELCC